MVLSVSKAVLVGPKLHATMHAASWGAMAIFGALVISAGGLGWSENANDYSRDLPPSTSAKRIVLAVTLGGAIPSVLLEMLRAALATPLPQAGEAEGNCLTAGIS